MGTPTHHPASAAFTRLAALADLHGDGPFALSANGADLVVVRTAAGYRAFAGRCPHQGALLGEGELDGDTLVCRNHRWRFDARTGHRRGGPECLESCALVRRGDALWADLQALAPAAAAPAPVRGLRRLEDLPGPRGIPLAGNLLQLDASRLHQALEALVPRFGELFRIRLGPQPFVVIARADLIEAVYRDRPEGWRRAENIAPILRELAADGVFSAEGEAWRPQRRLAMQALAHRNLKTFYPALARVLDRLRVRWERKADAGATLDIAEELKRFTVDVTMLLVFGYDADTIGSDGDVVQRKLGLLFPTINRRLFAVLPTWRWVRMPADRRVDRAVAELRAWMGTLVSAARARLAADPSRAERPENFLESMVLARDAEGRPYSEAAIFGNALTMLLAGEDTTAYTLAWAVHHLCDAPGAVDALREEAARLGDPHGIAPGIAEAERLAYAGAVANETMRVRPVAPLQLYSALKDTVLGDVAIPAGTGAAVLTRAPAMDARHFGDPAAFRPERWLEGATRDGAHEPGAHMPFGSGPRICPGRSLALLEMKVLLSMLHASFEVERVGRAEEVRERFAFTMHPEGLRVRLRRRGRVMGPEGMEGPRFTRAAE